MNELQQIVAALEATSADHAVLVTLVKVEGSSYRRPGARLLLTAGNQRIGSISGGCLEDDVMARARRVRTSGKPEMITYDTTSENDLVWGVGLGCHGVVHLLVERLPPQPVWAAKLRENLRYRKPTELAVLWGSSDCSLLGTRLAAELIPAPPLAGKQACPSSAGFQPAPGVWPNRDSAGFQPASVSGGQAGMPALRTEPQGASDNKVFHQVIAPPVSLVIFGAGDDARPLVRFAKALGWYVCVVDPRPASATPERFPEADVTLVARAEEAVARINPEPDSVAIVMTHHYLHDVPLLRSLLPRPLAYLGLLGPRKRADRILAEVEAGGLAITSGMRLRLHAPVGLDLGADGPDEVALAILAEAKAALAGRDARPLRERQRPIHAE